MHVSGAILTRNVESVSSQQLQINLARKTKKKEKANSKNEGRPIQERERQCSAALKLNSNRERAIAQRIFTVMLIFKLYRFFFM